MGRHHALKPHHLHLQSPAHSAAPIHLLKTSYASPSAILSGSSISALSVGDRIPGFRVSAAFLSSLHSNIFIELESNYDSLSETSQSLHPTPVASSSIFHTLGMSSLTDADLAPPDALRLPEHVTEQSDRPEVKEPVVDDDGIPLLKTLPAQDNDARAEALHIIADTVAQQRNLASKALILHPIALALYVAAFGVLRQVFYNGTNTDYIKILTTFVGVIMAVLGAIRLACGPYIFEAERVGTWLWLDKGRTAAEEEETGLRVLGDSDEVLLTRFGEDFIGAIIFRGVQPVTSPASPSGNKRARRAQSPTKHPKMIIRAWSVRQKYRRKEVGTALLEDAIKIGKEKGWTVGGIEFAADHANHKRVLPTMFNGALDKFETIAQKTLAKKVQEIESPEKGRKRK